MQLVALQFVTIEGWPSVFKLVLDASHVVIFIVYVDDLLLMWTKRMLDIIDDLRKDIKMEDPHDLVKYLGCVHHIATKEINGESITEMLST